MFILLSKSYLILNEVDLKTSNDPQTNRCVVFNLKDDATEPQMLDWPPSIVSETTVAADGDKQQKTNPKQSVRIICGCVSTSEEYIALCDDNKNLVVFNRQLEAIRHFVVKRNCVKILFKYNDETVLGCDKSGDIYEFDLSTSNTENADKLLLGHCSMLLDFTWSKDGKYVISCDRDEKIRVTHYPNTYNVQSYCLGHEEFVSSIRLLDQKTLVSGSGDGSIMLWDYIQGKNLFSFNFDSTLNNSNGSHDNGNKNKEKSQFPIKCITTDQENANYLATSFYKQPLIYIFKIVRDSEQVATSLQLLNKVTLEAEPIWMQFDLAHCNFLWVLGGSKTKLVELFELKQENIEKAFNTLKIVDVLNESQQLSAVIEKEHQQDPVDGLFKHYYNNVEAYLQRKMLRIENENKTKRFV